MGFPPLQRAGGCRRKTWIALEGENPRCYGSGRGIEGENTSGRMVKDGWHGTDRVDDDEEEQEVEESLLFFSASYLSLVNQLVCA